MRNPDALGCYAVTSNIDEGSQAGWNGLLGTPDEGIDAAVDDELCKVDPLPLAMNVLRQQMIAKVVATAFFERYFATDPERRRRAGVYLEQTIAGELPEVAYRRSRLPPLAEPTAEEEEQALTDAEKAIINALIE